MPESTALTSRDPREIGAYRLLRRIGAGGQGVVYLGTDGTSDPVAIKVLSAGRDIGRLKPGLQRELDGARSVAAFVTAQVLAFDLDAEPPYIVTEYVEGPTLHEEVRAGRGPLRGSRLADVAIQTAIALEAVHAANIVHCDFKPGNIILGPGGVKVIDFGIARAWDVVHQAASRVVGSAHFMAPEQVNNSPLGPAVDMFSWGATMVFAATGQYAFDGTHPVAVGINVVTAEPDLHGLGGALGDLVRNCLHKDPARRPTAAQVRQALMAPANRPPEPDPRPGTAATPEPDPGPGTAAFSEPDPRPGAAATPEPDPRLIAGPAAGRRGRGVLLGLLVVLLAAAGAAYGWSNRDRAGPAPRLDANVQALQDFAPDRRMGECPPLPPTARQLARRSCTADGAQATYALFKSRPVDERAAERARIEMLNEKHSPADCRRATAVGPGGRRGTYIEYTYQAGEDQKWYVAIWFDDGLSHPSGSAVMTMRKEWDRDVTDPARSLRETWLSWGYRLDG